MLQSDLPLIYVALFLLHNQLEDRADIDLSDDVRSRVVNAMTEDTWKAAVRLRNTTLFDAEFNYRPGLQTKLKLELKGGSK